MATVNVTSRPAAAERVIRRAMRILEAEMREDTPAIFNVTAAQQYLALRLGRLECEVFMCVWLDSQNRVIELEELFRGTLTQTAVYPREVIKSAIRYNAASAIIAHNHPSGVAEPSIADETLTRTLAGALAMIDVNLLDHFIIAGPCTISLLARGVQGLWPDPSQQAAPIGESKRRGSRKKPPKVRRKD